MDNRGNYLGTRFLVRKVLRDQLRNANPKVSDASIDVAASRLVSKWYEEKYLPGAFEEILKTKRRELYEVANNLRRGKPRFVGDIRVFVNLDRVQRDYYRLTWPQRICAFLLDCRLYVPFIPERAVSWPLSRVFPGAFPRDKYNETGRVTPDGQYRYTGVAGLLISQTDADLEKRRMGRGALIPAGKDVAGSSPVKIETLAPWSTPETDERLVFLLQKEIDKAYTASKGLLEQDRADRRKVIQDITNLMDWVQEMIDRLQAGERDAELLEDVNRLEAVIIGIDFGKAPDRIAEPEFPKGKALTKSRVKKLQELLDARDALLRERMAKTEDNDAGTSEAVQERGKAQEPPVDSGEESGGS